MRIKGLSPSSLKTMIISHTDIILRDILNHLVMVRHDRRSEKNSNVTRT